MLLKIQNSANSESEVKLLYLLKYILDILQAIFILKYIQYCQQIFNNLKRMEALGGLKNIQICNKNNIKMMSKSRLLNLKMIRLAYATKTSFFEYRNGVVDKK